MHGRLLWWRRKNLSSFEMGVAWAQKIWRTGQGQKICNMSACTELYLRFYEGGWMQGPCPQFIECFSLLQAIVQLWWIEEGGERTVIVGTFDASMGNRGMGEKRIEYFDYKGNTQHKGHISFNIWILLCANWKINVTKFRHECSGLAKRTRRGGDQ